MLLISLGAYGFMLFGSVALIVVGLARGAQAARLTFGPSVVTTASVISRDEEDGRLQVFFAFQPPGAAPTYVGTEEVSADEYAAAEDGTPVEIAFLRDDPNTNWAVGHSPLFDEAVAAVFGVGLGVFALAVTQWRFGVRGLRDAWRASRFP
jgi:hypothetical protein